MLYDFIKKECIKMKIYSVNTIQPRNYSKPMLKKTNEVKSQFLEKNNNNQLAFK